MILTFDIKIDNKSQQEKSKKKKYFTQSNSDAIRTHK